MSASLARALCATALAALPLLATPPPGARPSPKLSTTRGCYLVGRQVELRGSGLAPTRAFLVTIDGVYFGLSTTDASGGFRSTLVPGGLGAGVAQAVEQLQATDGTSTARAVFTLTRRAGARFLGPSSDPRTLRAPLQAWGFSLDGKRRKVYLHYVDPSGNAVLTASLGRAGGQCGYLRTRARRVLPFTASPGSWTLQLDTSRKYALHPSGPVATIGVVVSGA